MTENKNIRGGADRYPRHGLFRSWFEGRTFAVTGKLRIVIDDVTAEWERVKKRVLAKARGGRQ